jgi:cytidylate kinase
VQQLVDQEFWRWLSAQQNKDAIPESRVRTRQKPMITISREYGARGGELGRRVARKLGIEFFGQELVHEVARRADVRQKVVEALDERTRTGVELWIDELLHLRSFAVDDYLHGLSETVTAIARHSPGVIVGRAGHLLLQSKWTLCVRCVAPLPTRVGWVKERERLNEREAEARIAQVDGERREFYRKNFDADVESPVDFDLVINTGALGMAEAERLIVEAYRNRFGTQS